MGRPQTIYAAVVTEIRPARPDDAAAVAQIWYEGWQEAHRGRVPDALVEVRTRESFDTRAAALVEETSVADQDVRSIRWSCPAFDAAPVRVVRTISRAFSGPNDCGMREP